MVDPTKGLELENFKSDFLRSALLVGLFILGLLVTIVNYALIDETVFNVFGGSSTYFALQVGSASSYSTKGAVLTYLRAKFKYARPVSLRFKLINTIVEITYPAVFILYNLYHQGLLFALDSPITYLYFCLLFVHPASRFQDQYGYR